ncbi:MAG: Ig domain-containing protein [Gemmatimonadota bacterium]
MRSRSLPAALIVSTLGACDRGSTAPDTGTLLVRLAAETGAIAPDRGELVLRGPSDRTRPLDGATATTVPGLRPGRYAVHAEAWDADDAVWALGSTDVDVGAGIPTDVTLVLTSFVPAAPTPSDVPTEGGSASFTVPPLPGAGTYDWVWGRDSLFADGRSSSVSGPSATLAFDSSGSWRVRVRGRTSAGRPGRWSAATAVAVQPRPALVLHPGAITWQTADGSTDTLAADVLVATLPDAVVEGLVVETVAPVPWLDARLEGSRTPTTLALRAHTSGLASGLYTAVVRVGAPDAATGRDLPVQLEILAAPPPPPPPAPPTVRILQPGVNETFAVGTPIRLRADALDPETGPLAGAQIEWRWRGYPPLGGVLGTGTDVTWTPQEHEAGSYSIEVVATDPGGLADTASVAVTVLGGTFSGRTWGPPSNSPITATSFFVELHGDEVGGNIGMFDLRLEYGPTPALGTVYPFGAGYGGFAGGSQPAFQHELGGLEPSSRYWFEWVLTYARGTVRTGVDSATTGTPITILNDSLPNGVVGVPYHVALDAVGGDPRVDPVHAFTLTPSSGPLPPGLSLQGLPVVLAGTPVTAGSWTFELEAWDFVGCCVAPARRTFTLVVH